MVDKEKGYDECKSGIIVLSLEQILWPPEHSMAVKGELLEWLLTDHLAVSVLHTIADRRIHVIKKPKSKKEEYIVTGGFIPYLLLSRYGWPEKILCVLGSGGDYTNSAEAFLSDLHLWSFSIRRGVVANAAMATLMKSLAEYAEKTRNPSGISVSFEHLIKGVNVLGSVSGFDPRAFRRVSKSGIPIQVIRHVCQALGQPFDDFVANDDVEIPDESGNV